MGRYYSQGSDGWTSKKRQKKVAPAKGPYVVCECSKWRYIHLIRKDPSSVCHGCDKPWKTTWDEAAEEYGCHQDGADGAPFAAADEPTETFKFKYADGSTFELPEGVSMFPVKDEEGEMDDDPVPLSASEAVVQANRELTTSNNNQIKAFKARTRASTEVEQAKATLERKRKALQEAIAAHDKAIEENSNKMAAYQRALSHHQSSLAEAGPAAAEPSGSVGSQAMGAVESLFKALQPHITANNGVIDVDFDKHAGALRTFVQEAFTPVPKHFFQAPQTPPTSTVSPGGTEAIPRTWAIAPRFGGAARRRTRSEESGHPRGVRRTGSLSRSPRRFDEDDEDIEDVPVAQGAPGAASGAAPAVPPLAITA